MGKVHQQEEHFFFFTNLNHILSKLQNIRTKNAFADKTKNENFIDWIFENYLVKDTDKHLLNQNFNVDLFFNYLKKIIDNLKKQNLKKTLTLNSISLLRQELTLSYFLFCFL